jgi:hypothetical protein
MRGTDAFTGAIDANSPLEPSMKLDLTDEEAHTLRELLHDFLPALRMEVARTDAREMRHLLLTRQELCERLLTELDQAGV